MAINFNCMEIRKYQEMDFHAIQFNLVVSTNEGAARLWKRMGFEVVDMLPKAFKSKSAGYVDALVMYKQFVI
jgi:ribosomal protein S18 acetylase RimI-like enzyme